VSELSIFRQAYHYRVQYSLFCIFSVIYIYTDQKRQTKPEISIYHNLPSQLLHII